MAEFLIKAQDAAVADPIKDADGCYKRGDIVTVMPDGHQWGKKEGLPKFVVVKVPGVKVETARKYLESETRENMDVATGEVNLVTTLRRKYKLRLDDLPAGVLGQIEANGRITVTWSEIDLYLRNKVTGLDER